MGDGVGGVAGFLLAFGEAEIGDGVIRLVDQSFFVTLKGSFVVLAAEVEVSDFDVFGGFVGIPGVKLLHIGIGAFGVDDGGTAHRVIFGVVFGRGEIDLRVFARALLGLAAT